MEVKPVQHLIWLVPDWENFLNSPREILCNNLDNNYLLINFPEKVSPKISSQFFVQKKKGMPNFSDVAIDVLGKLIFNKNDTIVLSTLGFDPIGVINISIWLEKNVQSNCTILIIDQLSFGRHFFSKSIIQFQSSSLTKSNNLDHNGQFFLS